ncbi:hypothetical protein V8E36_009610 [Tilletia maclaganii]
MSSKHAQSMAAQDWPVNHAQVLLAAQISLANASSTTDTVKRQQEAIIAARKLDPDPSHHSDLLQAEMHAIRGMIEPSAKTAAGTDGASRRAASPLPADTQPAPKRSRQTPAPSHGPGPIEAESGQHSALIESVVRRLFGVPELVSEVFQHLVYERIDLVSLSKVSKSCRSIALPMLVESLSIAFSKAETFSHLFSSNPGRIAHVRYLRLWDDVAYTVTLRRRSDPTRQHFDADWAKLGNLIAQFDAPGVAEPPVLELLTGQIQLLDLRNQFLKAPRLLGRLTSLQVVDDFLPSAFEDDDGGQFTKELAAMSTFHLQFTESLTLLLHDCFNQQDVTGATLRKFALEAARGGIFKDRACALPHLGPRMIHELARGLTHLRLDVAIGVGDLHYFDNLLKRQWPKLESIDLRLLDTSFADGTLSSKIGDVVRRNIGLRHICALVLTRGDSDGAEWSSQVQPDQIATFSFHTSCHTDSWMDDFVKRHKALRELHLPSAQDGSTVAAEKDVMRSLRILRGNHRAIDNILRQENQIREVHIEEDHHWSERYRSSGEDLLGPGIMASTVTFVSLQMHVEGAEIAAKNVRWFPNVVELELIINYRPPLQSITPVWAGFKSMWASLEAEVLDHTPRLQVLLIRDQSGIFLPLPENGYVTVPATLPQRLQYVLWGRSRYDVRHFRVLRSSASSNEQNVRLQLLPTIFRPKVDRSTGLWEDDHDSHYSYALFDHVSGDEPRLKHE